VDGVVSLFIKVLEIASGDNGLPSGKAEYASQDSLSVRRSVQCFVSSRFLCRAP
jgi:hypothetical protein